MDLQTTSKKLWQCSSYMFFWLKGAGNIEYGDIKNGEIEKTGTSKKKWGTKF